MLTWLWYHFCNISTRVVICAATQVRITTRTARQVMTIFTNHHESFLDLCPYSHTLWETFQKITNPRIFPSQLCLTFEFLINWVFKKNAPYVKLRVNLWFLEKSKSISPILILGNSVGSSISSKNASKGVNLGNPQIWRN